MLEKIKRMIRRYCYIVTATLFATAAFISAFNRGVSLDVTLLWQIFIVTFICTLGELIYPCREITKRQVIVCMVLHYLYINAVIFGCAYVFCWYPLTNVVMSVFMFLCIAVIFAVISWFAWHEDKKTSDQLNQCLEEYREGKGQAPEEDKRDCRQREYP